MPADSGIHFSATHQFAMRQRQVLTLHGACFQLAHQRSLRDECLGHCQQTAGVLVYPMHNTGARHCFKLRRVMQQCIEQSAFPVTAARMHHQADRLVDHQQRIIFKNDLKRDVLGKKRLFGRMRLRLYFELFPAPDFLLGGSKCTIYCYLLLRDPFLQAAARVLREKLGHCLIKP